MVIMIDRSKSEYDDGASDGDGDGDGGDDDDSGNDHDRFPKIQFPFFEALK